ncbi:MAG: ATP-binding protein [Syntrophobacteraceae bacterium]
MYRRFFDKAGDPRLVSSGCGKILDVNQAGVELLGYCSRQELLDLENVCVLFKDSEQGRGFQKLLEVDGCLKDFEVFLKKKDGTVFCAAITAALSFAKDGSVSWEGVLRDLSELKKLQCALREVEKRNRELCESGRRIRELNKHVLDMLMIMSHDIRGPLVSIGATLKLLLRGSFGRMDESVWNTVSELMARVKNLISIAQECLENAHAVDGTVVGTREKIDLRQDIIDPILDEMSCEIEQQQIVIDNRLGAIPAGTIPISSNMTWLKAVFRNLFKNGMKYGGKGCTIAFGFEDHGEFYRLNVYNSGPSISVENREKLFTKFSHMDEGAEKQDGLGMGLYLIRELIRKYEGDMWYEPRADGSDFIFILPKRLALGAV